MLKFRFVIFCAIIFAPATGFAEGPPAWKEAAQRGLKLGTRGADSYPQFRSCFSCHHQTLSIMMLSEADEAGITFSKKTLKEQAEITRKHFSNLAELNKQSKKLGGHNSTLVYGIWTFWMLEEPDSPTTAEMVKYLLQHQSSQGHWTVPTGRPPIQESALAATTMAVYGITLYQTTEQEAHAKKAIVKARTWIEKAPLKTNEDYVWRLWDYVHNTDDEKGLNDLQQKLIARQHKDGGWSQLDSMESDAYATGQVVSMLLDSGLAPEDKSVARGIEYLLKTQHEDGSWFVATRAKPVQRFFDNGDPHGVNQFISISATYWATTALMRAYRQAK
ncbi:MAG: prenyltransferase/squalene oxidase repeat-containing protein [Zavarzinella sp.]